MLHKHKPELVIPLVRRMANDLRGWISRSFNFKSFYKNELCRGILSRSNVCPRTYWQEDNVSKSEYRKFEYEKIKANAFNWLILRKN
jgi:hypothetical protein